MNDHPGHRLRELLKTSTVVAPGAFNALVARAVATAGFDACYVSGGATANVAGFPDIGLLTLEEVARTIRQIADASGLPVLADADTGYGQVESVIRTVNEYERAGAAGMHIDDQVFPKRCGHLDGKQLVPADEMCRKIEAAVSHRIAPDFLVVARTDARGVTGMDDAVDRAMQYRSAGADMIFPEGLRSLDEFVEFADRCPGLLLANMTEFGKTPDITVSSFSQAGYDMVIFPLSLMRLAMGAVEEGLSVLSQDGSMGSVLDRMQTRAQLYELLDYSPDRQWVFPSGNSRAEAASPPPGTEQS